MHIIIIRVQEGFLQIIKSFVMLKTFSNRNFRNALKIIAASLVIYIVYIISIGFVSDTCKDAYAPPQLNSESGDKERAVVMSEALAYSIEHELNSFFGWIPNDLILPASCSDNISSYQSGVIYATRPASDILAKTISRFGTKGTIDQRLVNATSRDFVYGSDVWGFWFIYDCESKYKSGIQNWRSWATSVDSGAKNAGIYNMKTDDYYQILKYCSNMLEYSLGILNDDEIGHFESDNAVYFAKGICSVVNNILIGLTAVDQSVVDRGGKENYEVALKQLDYIRVFNPVYVFAGGNAVGDAMLPNHVAALARHIDIASNRINDIMRAMEK